MRYIVLYLFFMGILLSSCGDYRTGESIAFEEAIPDQKSAAMSRYKYSEETPILIVVNPEDRTHISKFVPTETERGYLEDMQLDDKILIGVFQGVKSNTIAGAEVKAIYQDGSDVYIHTFFTVPRSGQLAGQLGGTSAYSIVAINNQDLQSSTEPLTFHLIDEQTQEVLMSTTFVP